MVITAKQRAHLDIVTRLIPGYDAWATAGACTFDYDEAQRACDFFPECLTHAKGEWAGKPIVLEHWQQGIIANAFGWKRPDGTRRYRTVFLYVPRKNAKTTLGAGIALYLMCCDGELGAEVYSAAADREQAKICFGTAVQMVNQAPALARRCQVYRDSITFDSDRSIYRAISADAHTKHGYNPHGALVDELHAHPNRDLIDVLETGMAARAQPLTVIMTTADFARESICNETHQYAGKVRDRVVDDPSFLPVIYEATKDDDWKAEETWRKANPNYGISVKPDYIRAQAKKAADIPGYENTFKRLHLNVVTEQANRWLPMDRWDLCAEEWSDPAWPEPALAAYADWEKSLAGRPCFGGLDLSSTTDLASLALVFPPAEDGEPVKALLRFWVPQEGALRREKRDRVPYPVWIRQGWITATPGDVVDYDRIRADILALKEVFDLREVAIDRWNATQLTNQLGGDGVEVVPFGQGFASLTAPSKELEKYVVGGQFRHAGNPVLRWQASNVALETNPAGDIKPNKARSPERIDGIVAVVMGIGRMIARDVNAGRSVYDERGITFL